MKQQADDADFDTLDTRHASVRWFAGTDARFAIGPSTGRSAHRRDPRRRHRHPRVVAARRPHVHARRAGAVGVARVRRVQGVARPRRHVSARTATEALGRDAVRARSCSRRAARSSPDSPEAEAFVAGDAQGDRRCTRSGTRSACATISARRPSTRSRSSPTASSRRENGIAGSVMDYNAAQHRAARASGRATTSMTTLGPYDYWAIEYGYRPLPPETGDRRSSRRSPRAARTSRCSRSRPTRTSIARPRPRREPVRPRHRSARVLSKRHRELSRELWQRAAGAAARSRARATTCCAAASTRGFRRCSRAAALAAKYVGGVHYAPRSRRHRRAAADAGAARQAARGARSSSRPASSPPTASASRRSSCAAGDRLPRHRRLRRRAGSIPTSAVARPACSALQTRGAGPAAERHRARAALLDTEVKVERARRGAHACPSSTPRCTASIWSELKTGEDDPARRAATCSASTCAASPTVAHAARRRRMPADARALLRAEATQLRGAAQAAGEHGQAATPETRAHLAEIRGHARRGAEGAAACGRASDVPQGRAKGSSCHDRRRERREITLAPLDNRALANLCGPLDANLRQIEAALDVTIAHRGGAFTIAGDAGAGRARRRGAAALLRARPRSRCRSTTSSSGLVEIATQPQPRAARRRRRRRAAPAHAPRRPARPHAQPGRVPQGHHEPRHHVRHRPGRHRQDLPRRRVRGRRARARRGQAHRARAARGRGRRAPGLPAGRPRAEGRSVPAPALRRAVRPHGLRQGGASSSSATTIEIAPLAYMRGRTLNHSFIILDEAQNTTPEQMKMFLTRIGFGTKAVITGDVTQIDLARGQKSGLIEARAHPRRTCAASRSRDFTSADVVRHPLVQKIIDAYERRAQRTHRRAGRASRAPGADARCRTPRRTRCAGGARCIVGRARAVRPGRRARSRVGEWCRAHGHARRPLRRRRADRRRSRRRSRRCSASDAGGVHAERHDGAADRAAHLVRARRHARTCAMHPTSHLELHEERAYARLHRLRRRAARPARAPDARGRPGGVPRAARGAAGRAARARDRRPAAGVGRAGRARRRSRARAACSCTWTARGCGKRARRTRRASYAEICALFDSVYVSFYKGIGALRRRDAAGPRTTSSPRRGCGAGARAARWCSCTRSSPRRRCASTRSWRRCPRTACARAHSRRRWRRSPASSSLPSPAAGQPVPRALAGARRAR